jgi:lysozyme
MNISRDGLKLIKSFEGYHTRLKNGDCVAYQCPAKVWTIGWGCTEGIKPGLVWTEQQAEDALLKEIAKFETGVDKLVTVDINQNEFDACVSLAYNIGLGGFGRSTVLRCINKGNKTGAARAFDMWTKGGGRVLPGLVSRRKREAALFLKPVEKPDEPYMPQAVEPEAPPTGAATTATVAGGAGLAGLEIVRGIASPESASSFFSFASAAPYVVGGILLVVLVLIYAPKIVPAKWRPA